MPLQRPSRQASSLAAKAIAQDAAVDDRAADAALDVDDDAPFPPVAAPSSAKRKRTASSAVKDEVKTPVRATRRKTAAPVPIKDDDDSDGVPSSFGSAAMSSSSASSAHPSSEDEDAGSSDAGELSSAPPSPKPRAKRARKAPAAAKVDLRSIEKDLPYEYDPTTTATKASPAAASASTASAAASTTVAAAPAKAKRAPRKQKEPSPERDQDGAPVIGADGQIVLKTPKKAAGGRKKVKEVVVHDVPEVEKMTTTFKGRLGYACLNSLLRTAPTPVFCSRTMRLATFLSDEGHDKLVELTTQNTADLLTILKWNAANNIFLFRLSSEMFAFASHPEHGYRLTTLPQAYANLQAAGAFAKEHNMRITVHPGQWTQLASPRDVVVDNAILELSYQCEMLDAMGVGNEGVMVIHMGGVYGDKAATLDRFRENYKTKVPDKVKQRLVLENDEICYSVDDLLPICRECEIPLVFDYHHDWINPSALPVPLLMPEILDTWKVRGGVRVKQHLSEPRKGAVTIMEKRGHADRCKSLPLSLQEGKVIVEREQAAKAAEEAASPPPPAVDGVAPPAKQEQKPETIVVVGEDGKEVEERVIPEFGIRMGLPDDVDLMIEAKDKEQAVLHLYNLYGLGPVHRGSYVPPKPEPEFPDSSDSGEDDGAADVDANGEPIARKPKKAGKPLTPMAKAKRAAAQAKMLAAKARVQQAAEKKAEKEALAETKAAEKAEKAAAKAAKAAEPKPKRTPRAKKAGQAVDDAARTEAELEKEVELEDELMKMERGGDDAGAAADLDRLGSDLSELDDEK